jgi:hypothetical protein
MTYRVLGVSVAALFALILAGCKTSSVIAGHHSRPATATTFTVARTTTTTAAPTNSNHRGPIGPASGNVEYVCYDDGGGAVIPAVTDSAGTWSCPSSAFPYSAAATYSSEGVGEAPIGYHFVCNRSQYWGHLQRLCRPL